MEKKVIIELVMDEIRDELVAGKDEEYYRLKNYTQEELNNPENKQKYDDAGEQPNQNQFFLSNKIEIISKKSKSVLT